MTEPLMKARVEGYTRKDGTFVAAHDRAGAPAQPKVAAPAKQKKLAFLAKFLPGSKAPAKPEPAQDKPKSTVVPLSKEKAPREAERQPEAYHPRRGENGERVAIRKPSAATDPSTWHDPQAVATFLPDGDVPPRLNGTPLTRWRDAPLTDMGWDFLDGINEDLDEPPMHLPPGKKAAAGVVIEEPDGRVWIIHPTNAFGGYEATFPKGTAEPDLSLQGNALKECFEELGFQVEITGLIGDFPRTTSVARMYRARRTGGSPASMGWESQAASLVPKDRLGEYLNMWSDKEILPSISGEDKDKRK